MKLADIMADMKGEMGQEWEKKGFQMPKFDIGALKARTHKAPVWVHFGAGNLFRAFPAAVEGMPPEVLVQALERAGATFEDGGGAAAGFGLRNI